MHLSDSAPSPSPGPWDARRRFIGPAVFPFTASLKLARQIYGVAPRGIKWSSGRAWKQNKALFEKTYVCSQSKRLEMLNPIKLR